MNGPANTIQLQNLPPQHSAANASTALPHLPPPSGSPNPTAANKPPTSHKPSWLPDPAYFLPAIKSLFILLSTSIRQLFRTNPYLKRLSSILEYWFRPLVCLAIYGLTLYTVWTARSRHTLLARVSPSLGTWLLAIFAKAGDICFAFAVEDTFDTIAWRKLLARNQQNDVLKLEWFLSVVSSTGFEGLVRILGRKVRRWAGRWRERFGMWVRGWKYPPGERPRKQEGGAFWTWTVARLVFLAILIPGPGIIIMANIDQTSPIFLEGQSMSVSAGLATFDPSIATTYRRVFAPIVSRHIQAMLQDRSLSWPTDSIDPACKTGKNCKSFLLAGPFATVSPWPFPRLNESNGTTAFRVRDAPFYQVDLWDTDPNSLAFSRSRNCAIYGGLNASADFSTLMCVADQDAPGVLTAGWQSCQLGYSTTNGSCLAPGSREDWGTYFRFYRRNATLTFSRTSFDIMQVTSLSPPQPQNITAASLLTAMDAIFYRPDQPSNDPRYDTASAEYLLTQNIGIQLWTSLYANAAGLNIGRDWLRNLVALPVYLFQPTYFEVAPYLAPLAADTGTAPQPNLPPENYVNGAYILVDSRAIPGRGTVYAYTAVAGLLLAFVVVAKGWALRWKYVGTSDFAVLDYSVLTRLLGGRVGTGEVELRERMGRVGREHGTSAVLDGIEELWVGLR